MGLTSVGPTLIIDGHNLFIRNYVAVPAMDRDGSRVGGTVGMLRSVRKLIADFRPSNVLVVWDGEGGSQRRRSIMSEYKAGRRVRLNREYDLGETAEDELANMRWQRSTASEYLDMLGVPQVRAHGVEADDLMAYVASSVWHDGGAIVVTTDRDLLQVIRDRGYDDEGVECHDLRETGKHEEVVTPGRESVRTCCGNPERSEVKVFSPIKKVMYDRGRFISDYGVIPENFRLVKALSGDSSDNIDGIKGFGPRTIAKSFPELAARRVTASELLEMAAKLKGTLGKRLTEQKSRFEENLRLVDLSSPMLSATAAGQARDALGRELGCKTVDLRVRMMRDGVSFNGDDGLVEAFRELSLRRKRVLGHGSGAVEEERE